MLLDINICKAPTEASAKAVIERPAIKEDVPPVKESAAMKIFKRPPIISSDDEGMTSNENSQASDYGEGGGRIMKTKTKGRKTLKHKKRKSHKNIKSKTRKHKMNKKSRSNKRR